MVQTLDAIFENGVFTPLKHPKISNGEHVKLTVETKPVTQPDDMLKVAAEVYEGLSDEQIDEIEQIALN